MKLVPTLFIGIYTPIFFFVEKVGGGAVVFHFFFLPLISYIRLKLKT
jgi:hypothetical protein